MKRLFVSATLIFLSSYAFAWPSAGDFVEYEMTFSQDASNGAIGTSTIRIDSIDAVNDAIHKTGTTEFSGSTKVAHETSKLSEMRSFARVIRNVLAHCASKYGGIPERLTTPAGTFETCRIRTQDLNGKDNGYQWVANVPFGMIKTKFVINGTRQTYTLRKFVNGRQ